MTAPSPLQDTDMVSRVETVVAADMDGETILMSVETGQYFHFDDVATDVWHGLERPRSVEELVAHLREIYDVSLDECRRDSVELITKLCDADVLRVARA